MKLKRGVNCGGFTELKFIISISRRWRNKERIGVDRLKAVVKLIRLSVISF